MLSSMGSIPVLSPLCGSDARPAAGMEQSGFSLPAGMFLWDWGITRIRNEVASGCINAAHAAHRVRSACCRDGNERA